MPSGNFPFVGFPAAGEWHGRTDIKCSLLREGLHPPDPADTNMARYSERIVATVPIENLVESPDGICDADDCTFESVEAGHVVGALLLHSASTPYGYIGFATGLPLTTDGGNVIVTWDNNPVRIYRRPKTGS